VGARCNRAQLYNAQQAGIMSTTAAACIAAWLAQGIPAALLIIRDDNIVTLPPLPITRTCLYCWSCPALVSLGELTPTLTLLLCYNCCMLGHTPQPARDAIAPIVQRLHGTGHTAHCGRLPAADGCSTATGSCMAAQVTWKIHCAYKSDRARRRPQHLANPGTASLPLLCSKWTYTRSGSGSVL
jgi:hypothetical protein